MLKHQSLSDQVRSVAQLCPTLCDPMNHSTPGLPVHHQLPEFTQTHVHRSVMPSSHLILCHPLLLLPPIPLSIRVLKSLQQLTVQQLTMQPMYAFQFSSVQSLSCVWLCNPMNPSMPGLPVLIIYSYIIILLYHSFINALFTNNYNATLMMLLMLFIFQFSKIFLLAKQKICYLL